MREIVWSAINRDEGTILAFSRAQACRLFDTLADDTVASLRDRAILSVGLRRCVSNRAVYLIWPLRHDPANKTHHQTSID